MVVVVEEVMYTLLGELSISVVASESFVPNVLELSHVWAAQSSLQEGREKKGEVALAFVVSEADCRTGGVEVEMRDLDTWRKSQNR